LSIGADRRQYQTGSRLVQWYKTEYCLHDRIDDFEQYFDDIAALTKQDVVDAAQRIAEEGRFALSLVGDIDEKFADKLYQILRPIWSH
jgi:predicted Zn-dependent peptidase